MEKQGKRTIWWLAGALILVCLLAFLWLGSSISSKSEATLDEVSSTYMEGMNDQLQKRFEVVINSRVMQADGTVNRITEAQLTDGAEIREELALCAKVRDFSYLALYRTDGTSDVIYGAPIIPSDQEEFLLLLSDDSIRISSGVQPSGDKLFLISVRVAYPMSDGGTSHVMVVGISMDFLRDTLKLDEKGSTLSSHIIDQDGEFIVRGSQAYRNTYFERIEALFETHNGKAPTQYEQELRDAMKNHTTYTTCAMVEGSHRNIYCSPLEGSNWYLLSVMPYEVLDDAVNAVGAARQQIILLGATILVLAFAVMFVLYYRSSKRQMTELSYAEQEANRANRAKSDFLSSMSHDIRTPMNGIVGMTAIAQANINDPARVSDCLRKIALSSKHLLGLINDVLDMSKVESGKLSLNLSLVSLRDTMENIVNIAQPQVKAKGLTFDISIHDIQVETVYCDSVRLNQVLINLMSNAIKFTPEQGSIKLIVTQESSPKGEGYVRCHFRVRDTGIGMSPEFQAKIFDQFTREENQQVQRTEGSGLGMAITKAIVDLMEGNIEVSSTLGKGSEFHVTLDLERATTQEVDMILPPWKMLVVDDDEDLCKSATASLKEIGVTAEWVTNGKMAIQMARQHHAMGDDYQIILLDWKMPGMDGLQTARELRHHLGDNIPILIISAYDWTDIEEEARAAGAQGFISKPLFKSNLFLGLSPYMLQEEASSGQTQESNGPKFQGKRILLAEDNDLNWEIAEVILTDEGFQLDRAENGQICVDTFSAAPVGTYDAILMDVRMPVLDGYGATKAIRALDRPDAQLPIIAMTADAFSEDIQHCLECGMNEHISKPIDTNRLLQLLEKYLTD